MIETICGIEKDQSRNEGSNYHCVVEDLVLKLCVAKYRDEKERCEKYNVVVVGDWILDQAIGIWIGPRHYKPIA